MGTNTPETGLRIGILTIRDEAYHPNARLLEAARAAGCRGMLIHPYRIWPATVEGRLGLIGRHAHRPPQVVLPRQGAEIGDTSLALIHHFQHMGIALINDHSAVLIARNKFLTLQVLCAAGLPCPSSVFVNDASGFGLAVDQVGGYPVVAKPVNARQGQGVLRIMDADEARRRVLAGLDRKQGVMVQRYIAPAGRRDIRVLVIDGEAVCAASLTPRQGEFRANFHLGADVRPMDLAPDLSRIGVAAAAAVGCDVAGVDMIVDADNRPLIIEVNYSPGFRGMEAASGLDIAGRIIHLAIQRYQTRPKANETD